MGCWQKIFTLFAILLLGACSHSDDDSMLMQKGELIISLNAPIEIGVEQTRAALGDGNKFDGGGMEDLTLVLVNSNNKVVAKGEYTFDGTGWSSDNAIITSYDENKLIVTSFANLDVAEYTLFAYANVKNSLDYFGDIQAMLNRVNEGDDFTLAEATFNPLGNAGSTTTPVVNTTNPMLLTACEKVQIEIGTTEEVIELIRPMVYFEFKVVNHCANHKLKINSLKFRNFNPQTAYITPHDAIYAEDATNNIYRPLPAFSTPVEVVANGEDVVYKTYLYENTAPSNRYQFDIDLELPDVGYESSTTVFAGLTQHTTALVANTSYVFKNTAGNYYLIDNGGKLAIVNEINNDNFLKAEFKFSTTSHGYLINEQSGNKFYRSTTASNSGDNLSLWNCHNGQYQLFYNSYFLKLKGSIVEYSTGENNSIWQLYTVKTTQGNQTQPIDPISAKNQQISYIQPNGIAAPLTQMLRNQKVVVTLNVYYEENTGTFRFYVEEWNENHKNNTSFD